MKCPKCQCDLQQANITNYETSRQNIDNKFHTFIVPNLPVLACQPCDQTFMTNEAERVIKKAFKKYLQDNKITVYADELVDSYLQEVPENDRKAVRDTLCDLVFFNFTNLSYFQMREWIKPLAAKQLDAAKKIAPVEQQPYLELYHRFVTSFLKDERTQYAFESWRSENDLNQVR